MSDQEDIPADVSELLRLGTIAEVDLAKRRCTVRYGDEDGDEATAISPPVRWFAPRCGKTKKWSPPSVGEQVMLLCPDGQLAAAVALLGIERDEFPLPGGTDEDLTEYEDGALLGYNPHTHALTAILPASGTAVIDAAGGITLRGPVKVEGPITATGTIKSDEDVRAGSISLKGHRHSEVQAGSAQTGAAL